MAIGTHHTLKQFVRGAVRAIFLRGVPLGRWLGVPVLLHPTLTLLIVMLALIDWRFCILVICCFTLVVAHEFGHAVAARCFGVDCERILLHMLGGSAKIKSQDDPSKEFAICVAGPIVNLVLTGPLCLLVIATDASSSLIAECCYALAWFNLLPVLPLDGGRILMSLLEVGSGNRRFANRWTGIVGCLISAIVWIWSLVYGEQALIILAPLAGFLSFGFALGWGDEAVNVTQNP